PDVQWRASWRFWGMPGVSRGKKAGPTPAGKAVPPGAPQKPRLGGKRPRTGGGGGFFFVAQGRGACFGGCFFLGFAGVAWGGGGE
ncbi:hypothetical protein AP220_28410, partial [Escherichia coli]